MSADYSKYLTASFSEQMEMVLQSIKEEQERLKLKETGIIFNMRKKLNTALGFYSSTFLRMHVGTDLSLVDLNKLSDIFFGVCLSP